MKNLIAVFDAFELNARLAIQISERLISAIESLKPNERINLVYLAFLMCLKETHLSIFERLTNAPLIGFSPKLLPSSDDDELTNLIISNVYKIGKQQLSLHLAPSQLIQTFSDSDFLIRNQFQTGTYLGSLLIFLQLIHQHVTAPLIRDQRAFDQALARLKASQNPHDKNQFTKSFNEWVTVYSGEKNQRINSMDFYTDLVELSCCLDTVTE